MSTPTNGPMDPIALALLTEREAREQLAEALNQLAMYTEEYAQGFRVSRMDLYLCEAKVHRAQANLQTVLASKC